MGPDSICCTSIAIPQGLEPRTVCLEGKCSIQLSYGTSWPSVDGVERHKDESRWPIGTKKKGKLLCFPFSHPLERELSSRLSCCQRGQPPCCLSSSSCPSSWHPWTQRQRLQNNIQQSGTCCKLRLWCWQRQRRPCCNIQLSCSCHKLRPWRLSRQKHLCCSSWLICSCRRSFRRRPSWRPWNKFVLSLPFCRQELQWIVRWPSKRRWRRHRGKGTFS